MDAVCFTPGGITVITGLLGVLASAIGVLYRQTVLTANARIAEAQERERASAAREEVWRQEALRSADLVKAFLERDQQRKAVP